ncbi:MAG TPA: hypothetical protein VGL22_00450 [Terracidiphilus sp.]
MLHTSQVDDPMFSLAVQAAPPSLLPAPLPVGTSKQLARMFRDPRVLDEGERKGLIAELREAVALTPHVAEVRVLLGMALCVDLQVQEAMEQLRTAAAQAPNTFIARLKYGELLMRLRICDKAEEETHQAALLASNAAQSELARRQAAAIRTMLREGIERGGYQGLLGRLFRPRSAARSTQIATVAPGGTN